jgi:MFS family permease
MNVQETPDSEKIFTKSFFLIFGALLFSALVMYSLMSTVTEYASSMGATATIAGLVSGVYVFGGLCSRIYSGNALERVGWKKIALIFMSIHFLACLFYFVINDVTLLLIVRFIHGIGFGATANAIVTIATAILPKKRFSEAFGYFMLGTTIAVGLGPFISGFLYDAVGPFGCFGAATVFSAIALACMFLIDVKQNSKPSDEVSVEKEEYSWIEKIFEIKAIPVSLFTGLTGLGYVSILSFYRLYAVEVSLTTVFSWFFIIYSIVLIASRPIAGRLQDKGGDRIVCVAGIIAQAIGLFLIAWIPSNVTVIICAVCCALGFGTLNSAGTTIVTRDTTENRRPYAVSTFFIFCDSTIGLGPGFLGCFVSAASGYAPIYFISSLITLLALPVCLYALKGKSQI